MAKNIYTHFIKLKKAAQELTMNSDIFELSQDIDQDLNQMKIENLHHDELINENKKKNRKEKYGNGIEAKAIKDELGNFNLYNSDAYKTIIKNFGHSIRFSELLGIINSINIILKIKYKTVLPEVTRNEKRSFQLLIKYVERNKELIYPYFQYISLGNSNFQKISLDIY